MPAKVADASVVAAWCFGETRALEAEGLLKDAELHAPLLLSYELTSIARRKVIEYPEQATAFEDALKLALAFPFHWDEIDHLAVLRLALESNLSTYDASYLYLARKLDTPLATFDQQLARAALNL